MSLRILVAGERFNIKSSHRLPNISKRIQRSKQRILPSPPWIRYMAKFTWHWMIAPCIHTVLLNIFPLFTQSSEQLSSWFHVNRTPKHTNFKPVKNASWFVKITLPWAPLPHLFLKCCIPRRPQVSFFPVSRGLFSLVLTSAGGGSLLLEQYPDALQDHRFRQD